jgi:aspartate kinase
MIITKFGGSSLASPADFHNVTQIIKSRLERKPVVVVSASGNTTDLLFRACTRAYEDSLPEALNILENLEYRHIFICKQLTCSPELSRSVEESITGYFTELRNIITCISLTNALPGNITAKALSYGELLSSRILCSALKDAGVNASFIDSRDFIITDENHLNAKPLREETDAKALAVLNKYLQCGAVPVIQGFIGQTTAGITTTLGRNGSDFTASITGAALGAEEIEIWTDVNGILTADPKRLSAAQTLEEASYEEAEELSYYGGEVLHPKTIHPAQEKNIPIRALNSRDVNNRGTLVRKIDLPPRSGVATITYKETVTVLNICLKEKFYVCNSIKEILTVLEKHNIGFSLMSSSQSYVSFVLEGAADYSKVLLQLEQYGRAEIEVKSLVCLIGEGLKNRETSAKVLKQAGNYTPDAIFHNPSLINLSIIIERERLDEVLQGLHRDIIEAEAILV